MLKTKARLYGAAFSILATGAAVQGISQSEINQLGANLTPIGAEKTGNADGSIPEWTGGLPTDAGQPLPNHFLENPFQDEQPAFEITASNYQQYRDKLTPGQVALFERYPKTFRMPIYQSRRTVGYPQ